VREGCVRIETGKVLRILTNDLKATARDGASWQKMTRSSRVMTKMRTQI
jgi:hypothetical protein